MCAISPPRVPAVRAVSMGDGVGYRAGGARRRGAVNAQARTLMRRSQFGGPSATPRRPRPPRPRPNARQRERGWRRVPRASRQALGTAIGVVFTPHRRWVGQRASDRVAVRSMAACIGLARCDVLGRGRRCDNSDWGPRADDPTTWWCRICASSNPLPASSPNALNANDRTLVGCPECGSCVVVHDTWGPVCITCQARPGQTEPALRKAEKKQKTRS
jgi:hypothetical protein